MLGKISGLQLGMCVSFHQVHLGGGIWVEEDKWHQLQRTQGDSKFTKNLAVMIWGTETLKNRSVTGVATKKKKDALPKPPLSPSKLKIVRGTFSPTYLLHKRVMHLGCGMRFGIGWICLKHVWAECTFWCQLFLSFQKRKI